MDGFSGHPESIEILANKANSAIQQVIFVLFATIVM
jgi:hypothetical protein